MELTLQQRADLTKTIDDAKFDAASKKEFVESIKDQGSYYNEHLEQLCYKNGAYQMALDIWAMQTGARFPTGAVRITE